MQKYLIYPMTKPRLGSLLALIVLCLLSLPAALGAQNQGRKRLVSMQLSSGVARVGERVRLSIICNDGSDVRVGPIGEVDGLRFGPLSGPRRSQSITIINGRRSRVQESRWSLLISPEREGSFTIPGVTLTVGGEQQTTQPVGLRVVRDMTGENLGFLGLRATPTKVVEGMPFTLELLFGWDAGVKANYANLSIPWWSHLYGAIEVKQAAQAPGTESVTVNGEFTVPIERVQSAEHPNRVVYSLRRSFTATRSGSIELPTSFLEFGEKSRSLFQNGVKQNYFVKANELSLEVVPLPSEGRPFEFSGAVGSFEVRASVDARDLVVGDSIKLTVDWTGKGNMEFFDAPVLERLDGFRGFQVYGSNEDKSLGRRRVVYDLAPLSSEVTEIPSIPLSTFDPDLNRYVQVDTQPIPLRVRALKNAIDLGAEGSEEAFALDIQDIKQKPLGESSGATGGEGFSDADRLLLGASAGLLPFWLLVRSLVRRRGDPSGRAARRRRHALRALQHSVSRDASPAGLLHALTGFLGDRRDEPGSAWIGRDLEAYARQHRCVDEELEVWRAAAELMTRLEQAVYGTGAEVMANEVEQLAQRWAGAGI